MPHTRFFYNARKLVIIALLLGFFMQAQHAHAATTSDLHSLIQALLKQIAELQIQLKNQHASAPVQGEAPEHTYTSTDDGKTGQPKITIDEPASRSVFEKQDPDNPIVVEWDARNIPENSVVEIELDTIKSYGGAGGGIWQGEIPEGDSTGSYDWEIYGEGRPEAGVYRVRVQVRACHSDGCDVNPRFPGLEERIRVHAKSLWKTISIVDGDSDLFASYKAVLNGRTVDSASDVTEEEADELCSDVYNDYETYNFEYGDVLRCFWDGDRFMTVNSWKG